MADIQVFEETFAITSVNSEKYDRVSRIYGTSTDQSISMQLDINHELFPVTVGDNINMVIARTLNLDGKTDDEQKGWRDTAKGEPTLADMYDYVCHGKNYRFEDGDGEHGTCKYYASFGGLLLFVEGPYRKLSQLKIEYVYMLLKK